MDDEEAFFIFWNICFSELRSGLFEERDLLLLASISKLQRRNIPKIVGYAETVIPNYTPDDFKYHFRINRESFECILNVIKHEISKEFTGGNDPICPSKQLLIFMCYMSNMESHREIGHYFGVSKSCVYNIIKNVSSALVQKLSGVINWPSAEEQNQIATEFQLKCGLPGIIGAVDGSHIRLAASPKGDKDYINRKGFPSIQLQAVVDNNLLMRNVYTGWPGCTHDARVLRNSNMFSDAEEGMLFGQDKYVIGDTAYPVKKWLITPFRDNGHLSPLKKRFNTSISSARQVVERAFGHLKGRFRRLREITVHEPKCIVSVIVCGCILHNLAIINHDDIENYIELENVIHPNNYVNIFPNAQAGMQFRDQLMQSLA